MSTVPNPLLSIFRWIAVIPASIICAYVIGFLLGILAGSIFNASSSLMPYAAAIAYATVGAVFVFTGATIAPNYKNICSLFLVAIIALFVFRLEARNFNDECMILGGCIYLCERLVREHMKILFGIIFYCGFLVMGFVQLMATYAFFYRHWDWNWLFSGIAAFILGYFPLIGSICGMIGAIYAWCWHWWQAALLFFWWPVLVVVFALVGGGVTWLTDWFSKNNASNILSNAIDSAGKTLDMPRDMFAVYKKNIFDSEKDFYVSSIKRNEKIEGHLFLFAANFCADNLESGRHHIYRGVLGLRGTEFRRICEKAYALAVEHGAIEAEVVENNLKLISDNIKQVG